MRFIRAYKYMFYGHIIPCSMLFGIYLVLGTALIIIYFPRLFICKCHPPHPPLAYLTTELVETWMWKCEKQIYVSWMIDIACLCFFKWHSKNTCFYLSSATDVYLKMHSIIRAICYVLSQLWSKSSLLFYILLSHCGISWPKNQL